MTDEPIKISWSQLRAHTECKQRSSLIRQGKRGPGQNLRTYYHGMVVDSAMREWLHNPHRTAGDMEERIDALIEEGITEARQSGDGIVRWRGPDDRKDLYDFCIELVRRLEPILYDLVLPHEFVNAHRFSTILRAGDQLIRLTGEMDLLIHDRGWQVWDLKGTKDNGYYRKVLGQLVFYDIATWCERGEKTVLTGLIQPMCDERVMPFTVTDDDRRAMLARILRMADDIRHERDECKQDTAGCSWCEVNHACKRFKPTGNTISLGAGLRAAAANGSA